PPVGTRGNSIAKVRPLFGLGSNQTLDRSIFGVSYLDHGKRLQKLLPERLPTITPVAQVVDLSFPKEIPDETSAAPVYQPKFEGGASTGTVVKANYQINFDTGSAKIKPSELSTLEEIRSLLIRAT